MEKSALISYIESSFIKDILSKDNVTDISYNGRDIYYVTNLNGNQKSEVVVSKEEAKDFLRQVANIAEKQFNYLNPILDLNIGRYRLSAVYSSIGRKFEDDVVTFEIRIASNEPKIIHDHSFMIEEVEDLFDALIKSHYSIVVCGTPGCGKTELQKYLLSRISKNERVLVIDNTIELNSISNLDYLDVTLWQADYKNKEASVTSLIKHGLRNNPDWMIVSEARGEEMNDLLYSAMTGVPLITTIHSLDTFTAPNRIAEAILLNERKSSYEDVLTNIKTHFKIFVYMKKHILPNGNIKRYISSIVEVDDSLHINEIYRDDLKTKKFAKISKNLSSSLLIHTSKDKIRRFIGNE